MTSDFVLTQLRMGLLAIIAYGGGAGWFTPAESTLFVALITAFGPLLVPFLLSWYSNWNTRKIAKNSVAGAVAVEEAKPTATPETLSATAGVAAMKGITLLLFALLLLPSVANAQQPKAVSALVPASSNPLAQILPRLIADAQAASDDAKSHSDVIAQTCYDAIVIVANQQLTAMGVQSGTIGPILVLQKARDIGRLSSTPQGTALIVGCAPLVQDAKLNMVQFFGNIGATALIKGLLIP